MQATLPLLIDSDFPPIQRADLETLQVNLGYKCNQSCLHCHVNAGPKRTEVMDRKTIKQLITFIESSSVKTLDLTGGAPELNPHFRDFVSAARQRGLDVIVEYGEAAFYGPKMDFIVKDALGRKWQLGTIQVDYNLPERFELEYVGADNEKHRPVMIHRAPFGSMERFVAVLLEHCAGKFPLWLTPDQAIVLPISEKYHNYAEKVLNLLNNSEIRALVDERSEKTGRKIRDAELKKIPYMLIVGEKEENDGTVSVRRQGEGDIGTFTVEEFVKMVNEEIERLLDIKI